MFAMKHISLGMQILLRNLAPLFTVPLEQIFGEETTNGYDSIIAIISIIPGTILYAKQDLNFNKWGIFWLNINIITNSFQKLLQRRLLSFNNGVNMSKMCMVLVNNLFSMIFLIPFIYLYEYNKIYKQHIWEVSIWYYGLLFLVSIMGICIGYAGISAQEIMSASSMLILVNSNKFVSIIIGMVFLSEPSSMKAIIGCILSILATIWYGYVKTVPSELSARQLCLQLSLLACLSILCLK
jgi:drug/metabolite transporter (DMT)-like permease